MKSEVVNHIDFANAILKNEKKLKANQEFIIAWGNIKYGSFKQIKDTSENITLEKLMNSLDNANRTISIVRYWIFHSNYESGLALNRELLGMIHSLSVGEEELARFETYFMFWDTFAQQST